MFVPCPHCGFLVASIVSRDGAPQRCPRCEGLLSPDVATEAESTPADVPDVTAAPAAPAPTAAIATAPASAETRARSPAPAPGASRKPRRTAPTFARTVVPKPRTGRRWPTWLAIAGLGLLLVVQLLLSQRATLAASERWRPVIAATCSVLMCELPPWREPLAFTMLARNVEQAGAPGVLAVTASFRNDARWPQPWPALRLSLSDVDGIPVAARVFQPDEYRGSGAAAEPLLAPGQSANVRFEVVEPTPEIVAFTFDFR